MNPLQFGPTEDLAAYPRDLARDTDLAEAAGVDLLFVPSTEEMYPDGEVQTTVTVAEVAEGLEGATRPTHFAGVATVVAKLFSIVGPCRAYFGEKDFQQLAVIRRMVRDLSMPVEVVPLPHGAGARRAGPVEPQRLPHPRGAGGGAGHPPGAAGRRHRHRRGRARSRPTWPPSSKGPSRPSPWPCSTTSRSSTRATLRPIDPLRGPVRLLAAARFGRARLIDNLGVDAG